MKITGIYKIESRCNPSRIYIGSAKDISRRWSIHLNQLRKNIHHSVKLQRHFNKYNEDDLLFSVILSCEQNELLEKEQFFIDAIRPYFNTFKIVNSRLGVKMSESTKQKMKGKIPWNKGMKMSEAHKDKLKEAWKTRPPMSNETKMKMSVAKKGKQYALGCKPSQETRNKLSESMKGKKHHMYGKEHTEETRRKMRDAWAVRKLKTA